MYEELIKALRISADVGYCSSASCSSCPADKFRSATPSEACDDGVMISAANALESLTARVAALSRVEAERDTANERGEYYRQKADEEIMSRLNLSKELEADLDAAVAFIQHIDREYGHYIADAGFKRWRGAQGEA